MLIRPLAELLCDSLINVSDSGTLHVVGDAGINVQRGESVAETTEPDFGQIHSFEQRFQPSVSSIRIHWQPLASGVRKDPLADDHLFLSLPQEFHDAALPAAIASVAYQLSLESLHFAIMLSFP